MKMLSETDQIFTLHRNLYPACLLPIVLVLLLTPIHLLLPQIGYAYEIGVHILSNPTPVEKSYSGSECRSVALQDGASRARAAPYRLYAQSSDSPDADAVFYGMEVTIQDRQKFLDLIPPGQDYLDLLLNVDVTVAVSTPLHALPNNGDGSVSMTHAYLDYYSDFHHRSGSRSIDLPEMQGQDDSTEIASGWGSFPASLPCYRLLRFAEGGLDF